MRAGMTKRHVSLPAQAEERLHTFLETVDNPTSSYEDTFPTVADVPVDPHVVPESHAPLRD